jgi:hypothetical protein
LNEPRCRECRAPGATVEWRALAFCSERCRDVFFAIWAVRCLAAICNMKTPSRPRTMARKVMRENRHW